MIMIISWALWRSQRIVTNLNQIWQIEENKRRKEEETEREKMAEEKDRRRVVEERARLQVLYVRKDIGNVAYIYIEWPCQMWLCSWL